jgi:NADH-quinone oxidoreductase subunit M
MGSLLASTGVSFNPLPWLVILPLVGALLVAVVPRTRPDTARQFAIVFSLIPAALSVYLLSQFHRGTGGFQFVINAAWSKSLGIGWHLGIDGISLFMVVLSGLLFPLAIIAVKPHHDDTAYYSWLLVLMSGCLGVFMALDLVLFFLFFEIVLVPMYFLIGGWGYGRKVYAANKFFLYTMFGSAFMLVGILATAILHQQGSGGNLTFDLVRISQDQSIGTGAARWLFLSFALAFSVKVPLFPLHTWLPDAHTEAPTAGSVILAGILLKLGTYGFIRIGLGMFPEAAKTFGPLFLTLAVIGIIYGAVCATMQMDLKRLVAYSSVAHLGFIVLGIFAMNVQGLDGAVMQMVNHGISTPALFLMVGMISDRRHTREIAQLNGIQQVAPIFAGCFMIIMLSSVGLPGLNGFVGEFLALGGAFRTAKWWAVVATVGVILAALYLLWAYQRVFHGTPSEENRSFRELRLFEGAVLAPLVVAIVFLGLYPKPMLDRIEPSVRELVEHVSKYSGAHNADVPAPAAAATGEGK